METQEPALLVSPSQSPRILKSLSTHNLAASPLTACSYQTMQQEYDRDTSRMYQRIQSFRAESPQQKLPPSFVVVEAVEETHHDDFFMDSDDRYDIISVEAEEDDGMFEFDF
jgi:hypothetical protein